MRLHRLRTHGFSRAFRDGIVELDLEALGPGLIAIVGGNGVGKTTLMELMAPATLYRTFPSYRETAGQHVAPGVSDAFSALDFELGGSVYQARIDVDPTFSRGRGKAEGSLAYHGDGGSAALLAGPLVREYDEAIAALLPSSDLFLASVFAAQKSAGFFGLPKGDRKRLFVEMLAIGHLDDLAAAAKERAHANGGSELAKAERDLSDAVAAQSRRAERTARRADADAAMADRQEAAAAAEAAYYPTTDRLQACRERHAAAEARAQHLTAQRQRLTEALRAVREAMRTDEQRSEELARLLDEGATIRDAAARRDRLRGQVEDLRTKLEQARGKREEARQRQAPAHEAFARHQNRLEAIAAQLGEEPTARAGQTALAETRAEVERLTAEAEAIRATLAGLQERHAEALGAANAEWSAESLWQANETRLTDLQARGGLLDQVPGVPACETCPLTTEARDCRDKATDLARELAQTAKPTRERREALEALEDQVAAADKRLRETEKAAEAERLKVASLNRWDDVDLATFDALRTEQAAALDGRSEAAAQVGSFETELHELGETIRCGMDELEDRSEQLDEAIHLANRTSELDEAQTQRAVILDRIRGAQERVQALEAELAEVGDPQGELDAAAAAASAASNEKADAERRWEAALEAREVADKARTRLDGELAALGDAGRPEHVAGATEALARIREELGDWTHLAKALGPDGVQALEIDAAGPTVTQYANRLLAECYGPRFQLALETTAETKDGRQKEVFEARILDAEAERNGGTGSGGEMVILDEAVRLAVAIFNAEQSNVRLETLFRDETAGALSPENADAYVAMLRAAMQLGRFHQCYFIAHQPAVWEQADRRIVVRDGQVTVES